MKKPFNLDIEQPKLKYTEPKRISICEHRVDKYCHASKVQDPVILCEYADYTVDSFYPTCSKGVK